MKSGRVGLTMLFACFAAGAGIAQTRTQTVHVGEPDPHNRGGTISRTSNPTGKNIPGNLPPAPGGGTRPVQPVSPTTPPPWVPNGYACSGNVSRICSAQVMAQVLFERYNSGYPVRTVKLNDASGAWLVLLAGTEFNYFQSNTPLAWVEAYRIGTTFRQYVADDIKNQVPRGSPVILVGHSLGGMLAENLAADLDFKARYKTTNVITYGSPKTVDEQSGTEYAWFATINDIVPTINPVNIFSQPNYHWVQNNVPPSLSPISTLFMGIQAHMNYPNATELSNFDALGRPTGFSLQRILKTRSFSTGTCLVLDQSTAMCQSAPTFR
jgi:pimeloyl-ACP methyl ester carboxylesterase